MSRRKRGRRLVITVCPREPGTVRLPVTRSDPARRLGAAGITRELTTLVSARGLDTLVRVQAGCAGGCGGPGPNISITVYPAPGAGEREDHIAVAWRTYVYSLSTLDCLATILDDNLR